MEKLKMQQQSETTESCNLVLPHDDLPRRSKIKKLLLFLGFLILPAVAGAQGIPFAVNPPAPNAFVTVCAAPAVGGNPCTNTVAIYPTAALSVAIPQPAQIGPTGNYTFFYAAVAGA